MSTPDISVEVCKEYTPEMAAGIGRLMPQLDESFPPAPIPEGRLRYLIDSPDYDQLVAVANKIHVVGAATMSVVRGAGFGQRGQLEDFVVDEEHRGSGVAGQMWSLMLEWCAGKGLEDFYLQTETYRPGAIKFYEKHAALLGETVTFKGDTTKQ